MTQLVFYYYYYYVWKIHSQNEVQTSQLWYNKDDWFIK